MIQTHIPNYDEENFCPTKDLSYGGGGSKSLTYCRPGMVDGAEDVGHERPYRNTLVSPAHKWKVFIIS